MDWEVPYKEQKKAHLKLTVYFLLVFIAIRYCLTLRSNRSTVKCVMKTAKKREKEASVRLHYIILLNKSLARILIRCPTLNEHESFYLM